MKTSTSHSKSPFSKKLLLGILLLGGFMLSSYKGVACTASFTYTAGVNGHYTFTSTSVGVGIGTQYSWNPGDGSGWHYGSTTLAYTYTANATYNARLAIYDSGLGCIDTSAITPITVSNVYTPCTLSASFTYTVTAHGVVNFTSTSGGVNPGTYYYWSPGDSNQRIAGGSSFTHTYLYQGTYTMWLTIEDTGLSYCIDSIPVNINVPTADSSHCHLHANFSYTIGANGEVTFTNTTVGASPGDGYLWTFGDTSSWYSGIGPVTHTYNFNGTYYASLYVYGDSNHCSDSIAIPITIAHACNLQANFSYVYDTAVGGQVTFMDNSIGTNDSTHYYWSFGDSTYYSANDTVTHNFPFIGYYTVTLTDSNANGCVSSVHEVIYIYNKDSLQACFTYYADSITPGEYHFNASCSRGTNANTYYLWTPGDGDPSDSGLGMSTYTHTYMHNGPYSATLTIWYTILPHSAGSPRYDESSYTQVITVSNALGVASVTDSKIYTVYPNPNDGTFNIAVNGVANGNNATIRISNMMGQVVYQANANLSNGKLNNISLPNAATGIYLLQIVTADNTYTSRIDIQK